MVVVDLPAFLEILGFVVTVNQRGVGGRVDLHLHIFGLQNQFFAGQGVVFTTVQVHERIYYL